VRSNVSAVSTGSGPLTAERILEAAEETLRRFGPAKTTVVDVARALGVSHGSVYRHFPTKADLRDAVVARWLERMHPSLIAVAESAGPAPERLRAFLRTLMDIKWTHAKDDPEVFAAYAELGVDARIPVLAHVDLVVAQMTRIVADGVARGEFVSDDPAATAKAVFDATVRFHHPVHCCEWRLPTISQSFDGVWALLLNGLVPRADAR
jgi:AcrR family transcriptional regulator